jgi:hypothetical protein
LILLETKDLFVIISVLLFTIPQLFLFSIIVENLSLGNRDFKYFLTGSYLIFYIAFVFPFMFVNVYFGIAVFWFLNIFAIAFFIFKKIPILKTFKEIKLSNSQTILIIILITTQILVLYGDAFFHISVNFPDTYYNYLWINENATLIGKVGYFPGLSIVSILPLNLINPLYSLNFFAASLGLVFTICINLILKPILTFKGLIVFNLILLTPFYYALTYTRVGLNNSQLFPIMFFSLIVFLISKWQDRAYLKYIYGLTLSVAALVTAPHIVFLTLPAIIISSIFVFKFSRKKTIIALITLMISSIIFARQLSSPDIIFDDKKIDKESLNLIEMFQVLIIDWARIKAPIRSPIESIESLGAYLIILAAVLVLLVSGNRINKPLMFVSVMTIVYGVVLVTGIGELGFMKGRIGWYFMWTTALFLSLIFDQSKIYLPKKISQYGIIGFFLIINFIVVIFNLPDAYRKDNETILIEMDKIVKKENRNELNIYTDLQEMRFISEKVRITQDLVSQKIDYFALNNNTKIPDINLANIRPYEDRNFKKFNDQQTIIINKRLEKNKAIFNYAMRMGYSVVIKEDEYMILKRSIVN